MSPAGFEPAIPASELPQAHALDRTTTETGVYIYYPSFCVGGKTKQSDQRGKILQIWRALKFPRGFDYDGRNM